MSGALVDHRAAIVTEHTGDRGEAIDTDRPRLPEQADRMIRGRHAGKRFQAGRDRSFGGCGKQCLPRTKP